MDTNRPSTPGTATDEPVPSVHLKSPAEADAYKAGIAEGLRRARGGAEPPAVPDFDPVPLRARSDGWTPERQIGFIRALAETACVSEACRRIGKSTESAYVLARRPDAQSFRLAWDIALDNAVRRVGDGAYSRAVNGVEIPHFYKGELVGTHRRFDERLTMFILRTRDPDRFGPKAETAERAHTREGRALHLGEVLHFVKCDAEREARGFPRIIYPELGAHANDDEDYDEDGENGARTRDMTHLYAFAPRVHEEEEDLEDEAPEGACGGRTASQPTTRPKRRPRPSGPPPTVISTRCSSPTRRMTTSPSRPSRASSRRLWRPCARPPRPPTYRQVRQLPRPPPARTFIPQPRKTVHDRRPHPQLPRPGAWRGNRRGL